MFFFFKVILIKFQFSNSKAPLLIDLEKKKKKKLISVNASKTRPGFGCSITDNLSVINIDGGIPALKLSVILNIYNIIKNLIINFSNINEKSIECLQ